MADQHGRSALRAVAHPLRLQMLSLLTGAELSAAEVARELGITHANASYHLRVLLDAGELVVSGEEKIRGGVAKRYRHDWRRGLRPGPPAPADDGAMYVRATADELVRRYAARAKGPGSFTDADLWVDPETYARARALLEEASSLVHGAASPPRTEGTVRMNLTAALFPMSPVPEHAEEPA
jgi:DNA-binding transcriptional ArsR family regulator